MVEVNGLVFDTSIGALFALKEARGHTTLQETYASVASTSMDNMLDVLRVCLGKGESKNYSLEEFADTLGKHKISLIKVSMIFNDVLTQMLFDGMEPEEIEDAKKRLLAKVQANKS